MRDVIFKEDQSRLRKGHGARNMAEARHFAINLVRLGTGKRSIPTMRKVAEWNPSGLRRILSPHTRQPGLVAMPKPRGQHHERLPRPRSWGRAKPSAISTAATSRPCRSRTTASVRP